LVGASLTFLCGAGKFVKVKSMASELAQWAAIRIEGADAERFLQSQLTSDLNQLQAGQPQLAGWCAINGRVRAVGWLARTDAGFVWYMHAAQAQQLPTELMRFVLRAKVKVALAQERVIDSGPDRLPDGRSLGLARSGEYSADAAAQARFALADVALGAATGGGGERHLPQVLGLERFAGLSLKKGCFPGQEIVARTYYKGEVKRALLRVRLLDANANDANVYKDTSQPSGAATSELVQFARTPEGGCEALIVAAKPVAGLYLLTFDGSDRYFAPVEFEG
jgi:tRNA-modifying protein YgfZ